MKQRVYKNKTISDFNGSTVEEIQAELTKALEAGVPPTAVLSVDDYAYYGSRYHTLEWYVEETDEEYTTRIDAIKEREANATIAERALYNRLKEKYGG